MSRMTVEYFNRSGHIPVATLLKDHEDGQKDVEKSQKSLEPFCLKWQSKAKLKQNKTEGQIKKDCVMIVKAFINADLDFDCLSRLYIKSRELPKESRNFVFENDVLAKLKPIWPLYAPPGLGLTSIIEVLVSMGDWLFPDPEPGLTSPESLEVMPLIIQKAPKVQLMSQKSRNENSKHSQSNLVGVNIIEEVSFDSIILFIWCIFSILSYFEINWSIHKGCAQQELICFLDPLPHLTTVELGDKELFGHPKIVP